MAEGIFLLAEKNQFLRSICRIEVTILPASLVMLRRLLYLSIEKLGVISNQSVSIPMIAYFGMFTFTTPRK